MGYLGEGSPARYHLETNQNGIQIAVHKDVIPSSSQFREEETIWIARNNDLPDPFIPPNPDREWGFGPVLSEERIPNSDFILYKCGLSEYFEPEGDPDLAFGTAATLMVLFDALNFSERDSASEAKQNLMVQMALDRKRATSGNPLEVNVYSPLTEWIEKQITKRNMQIMINSMQDAFYSMWNLGGDKRNLAKEFSVQVSSPGIIHFTTGDASGLDPEETELHNPDMNYRLTAHNTDTPIQQLSLLAGVAKLEELATGKYYRIDPNQLELGLRG